MKLYGTTLFAGGPEIFNADQILSGGGIVSKTSFMSSIKSALS